MDLKDEFLSVARALGEADVPYALCGGMAVVLHGYPRLTRDIDLLIQSADLDRATATLRGVGFTIPGGIIPFDLGKERERRIFRVSKRIGTEILTADLLLLPPYLRGVWEDREVYDVDGTTVTVVSRAGLLEMKRIAGRPQDLSDVENLESIADDAADSP
jgi:hypothetical protein